MSFAGKTVDDGARRWLLAVFLCVFAATPAHSQAAPASRCPLETLLPAGTVDAIGNCDSSAACDKLITDALSAIVVPAGGVVVESEERLDAQAARNVDLLDDVVKSWLKLSPSDLAAAVSDYVQSESTYNRLPERFEALFARRTKMLNDRPAGTRTAFFEAFNPKLLVGVVWHGAVLRALRCVSDECRRARQTQIAAQYESFAAILSRSQRWREFPIPLFRSVFPFVCPPECTTAVRTVSMIMLLFKVILMMLLF